jgi:peptide deformylase
MILDFNQVTNPKEKEILKTRALPIDDIGQFMQLIEDLKDTANHHEKECVGIASNQIWQEETPPPTIFIAKLQLPPGPAAWKIFINPVIKGTGTKIKNYEGCMSLAGRKPKAKKRDKNVTVTYWDISGEGSKTEKFFGSDARIIQHEFDHLLGKLI